MRFNKKYLLITSFIVFMLLLTVLVLASISWHNPENLARDNTDNAVTISCSEEENIDYIRHCWTTHTTCEPGLFDVSTCKIQEQSCQVTQQDIEEWTLCSRCKDALGWSKATCTGPYTKDYITDSIPVTQAPIYEEGATYTKFSVTKCSNGICNTKSYINQIAIQNEQGIWRPFNEVVKVDSSNNLLTIEWNNKKVTFAPYIVYKDTKHRAKVPGQISTLAEIPPGIPLQHQHTEKEYKYKYDMIIQQLSEQASQDISKIGLEIAEVEGFSEDEIKYRENNIFLPEGIKFSWDDAAKQGFDVARSQKGMEVTNVKGMRNIMIDPEISGSTLADVEMHGSAGAPGVGYRGYFKFDLSGIVGGATINSSNIVFNVDSVKEGPLGTMDTTYFYNCSGAWTEGSPASTIHNLPCTYALKQLISSTGLKTANVTTQVNDSYHGDNNYITFALNTTSISLTLFNKTIDADTIAIGEWQTTEPMTFKHYNITSSESSPAPYLNITYGVVETDLPWIKYIAANPANNTWISSTTVFINATVYDATTNIANCTISYGTSQTNLANYTMGTAPGPGSLPIEKADAKTCNYTISGASGDSYFYKVIANDTASNMNETSLMVVYIDADKPTIEYITPTPANASYPSSKTIYFNTTIWDNTTNITGCFLTIEFPSNAFNRTMTKVANSGDNKNVTCNYTFTALPELRHTYKVWTNDSINNVNETNLREFTVDITNPLINFTQPTYDNGSTASGSTIPVNVTITETNFANYTFVLANSTAEVNLTVVTSETATMLNFTSLADDTYKYNVTITDLAGNKNFTETRTIIFAADTSVPTIEYISATPSNSTNQTATTIYLNTTVVDTISNIDTCLLTWKQGAATATNKTMTKTANGGDNKNVTCNYTHTSLADAIYTYKVLANDTQSNFNLTNVRQVIVDAFPPEAVFISTTPANSTNTTSTIVYINATISDRDLISPISACTLTWKQGTNAATNKTMTKTANGGSSKNVTCNYTHTSLTDAIYTYKILMNDTLNNFNLTNTRQVIVDAFPPKATFISATPANASSQTTTTVHINVTAYDSVSNIANCILSWAIQANTLANLTMTKTNNADGKNITCNYTQNSLGVATYNYKVIANDTISNMNETSLRIITITSSGQEGGGGPGDDGEEEEEEEEEEEYDPCEGLSCGNVCDPCAPGEECGQPLGYCTATGSCVSSPPDCGEEEQTCTPGEIRCSSNKEKVEECNSEGTGWETKEVCVEPEKCDSINGEPQCICVSSFSYGEWSECINGWKEREITDLNGCMAPYTEQKKCGEGIEAEEKKEGDIAESKKCTEAIWLYSEWGKCKANYDIDQIAIKNMQSLTALGIQERVCIDTKGCMPNRIEVKECEKIVIELKKEEWCFTEQTVIVDVGTQQEVSRIMSVVDQGVPRVNLLLGEALTPIDKERFCWYCEDGRKDYDEEGVDCGGPSCPACEFILTIKKPGFDYVIILYWLLISWLALIVIFLLWLESKKFRNRNLLSKLKAINSLIHYKKYGLALTRFNNLRKSVHIGKTKDKQAHELYHKISSKLSHHHLQPRRVVK